AATARRELRSRPRLGAGALVDKRAGSLGSAPFSWRRPSIDGELCPRACRAWLTLADPCAGFKRATWVARATALAQPSATRSVLDMVPHGGALTSRPACRVAV